LEGKRFIHSLKLKNFLSYGSQGEEIEMQPLNVIIGANSSGKSNLIEAMAILKAIPTDLLAPIRQGGGVSDFLWKGENQNPVAKIEAKLDYANKKPLHYSIDFTVVGQKLEIVEESIEEPHYFLGDYKTNFSYRYQNGVPVLNKKNNINESISQHHLRREDINLNQSIISQRKDPDQYPELTYLNNQFSNISLYRDWHIGRNSQARMPQKTDLPEHPLLEDGSNLGVFLNNLQYQIGARDIIEKLKKFYDEAEELTPKIYGGTVQIFIRETGLNQPIPATRLSDGTLRYLFLMALLLDPTPPPVICIEEPEIGLHPDILSTIAEMLIEASKRTQIIVTTHSDALISSLPPESVLVCERDTSGTHLRRLDSNQLKTWLENYSLGDLWRMGEIGGNRW
jgi:predicted ATPase